MHAGSSFQAFPAALLVALAVTSSGAEAQVRAQAEVQRVMAAVSYSCDAPNSGTMAKIKVAALPIVSNGAMFAAYDQGAFRKHGLDVEFSTVSTVPATISAVQGGSVDVTFTATLAMFQAIDRGIQLTVVAPFAGIEPGYWDKMKAGVQGYTREISALLVAPNSPFKTPGDLNGRTVAVGDAKGQSELTTRYVIKAHGGNPDSVKFVVMSYADAVNALMAGQVDAAFSAEPAMTRAEKAGYRVISWPGVETFREGPTSAFVSSSSYVLKNPELVARFNCAIRDATALGRSDHPLVRRTSAKYQNVDPGTLAEAVVPYYFTYVDMSGLGRFYQLEKDAGYVRNPVDLNAIVIPQAIKPQ